MATKKRKNTKPVKKQNTAAKQTGVNQLMAVVWFAVGIFMFALSVYKGQ